MYCFALSLRSVRLSHSSGFYQSSIILRSVGDFAKVIVELCPCPRIYPTHQQPFLSCFCQPSPLEVVVGDFPTTSDHCVAPPSCMASDAFNVVFIGAGNVMFGIVSHFSILGGSVAHLLGRR